VRILLKYPTRQRPQQFLARLREWVLQADRRDLISVVVSYDDDDPTMTLGVIAEATGIHPAIACHGGISESKIHAINRDMDKGGDWDIVLIISDDFFCRRRGWDSMVAEQMAKYFPDTDGSLWFYDGSQRKINTLPCLGRKYYDRFGYIYHPGYKSFFCDNEQTDVGLGDRKLVFIDTPIATHEHPAWGGGMKRDALYDRNNKFWKADEALYHSRKAAGFP